MCVCAHHHHHPSPFSVSLFIPRPPFWSRPSRADISRDTAGGESGWMLCTVMQQSDSRLGLASLFRFLDFLGISLAFFKILVMVMSSFPVCFFLCNTGSDAPVHFRAVAVGWSRPQTACKEVSTLPLTLQGSGHTSEKMGAVMSFAGLHCVDQVCTFTSSCSVIVLSLSVTD